MTPTTKQSSVDPRRQKRDPYPIAGGRPGKSRSGGADEGTRGAGGHWKTRRAFSHSTAVASKATRAMGSSQGVVQYRRSDCRFRAGQCLGRPRWRRSLAGGRGGGRFGPRWAATFVGGTARTGSIVLVLRRRTPRLSHFGQKKKLGPILRPVLAALKESEPEVAVPSAAYAALSRLRELS